MNMEEESKYDFGSYLLDKAKGVVGRSKHTGGRTSHGVKKGGFAGIGGISGSATKPPTSTQKTSDRNLLIGQDKTPTKRKTGVTKR